MSKFRVLASMLVLISLLAIAGSVENADVRTVAAGGDPGVQIASIMEKEDAWVMWSFDRVPGSSISYNGDGPCRLVLGKKQNYGTTSENDAFVDVLLELRNGEVADVKLASQSCAIDGSGQRIYQFTGMNPAKSIDTLAQLLGKGHPKKVRHNALTAVALHDHDSADTTLANVVESGEYGKLAEQAVFWMGQARGAAGLGYLEQYAVNGDAKLRHHVTFGLYVSKEPGAQDALYSMAREDSADKVRAQAIFWLAQKGAPGILDLIDEIIAEMPGKHLVEQSIFALSQIPDNGGISRLKELANNHENGKIRAKALFWLAQEGGEEAFAMLEAVLKGNPSKAEAENALMLISQTKSEGAAKLLLDTARKHENPKIRSNALFWLSQSAAEKISDTLLEAIEDDPDTEVKKQAVFGISQRPREEAIPMLAKLVREHKNAAVRKQAIFWLGQLGGEEALAVIEEVMEQ